MTGLPQSPQTRKTASLQIPQNLSCEVFVQIKSKWIIQIQIVDGLFDNFCIFILWSALLHLTVIYSRILRIFFVPSACSWT
ncbi:hypothetical protein Mapa_017265 [Marchantia paleacea]|nr:hypothetical protein Mapa_017265 [Marchantia paleacea]